MLGFFFFLFFITVSYDFCWTGGSESDWTLQQSVQMTIHLSECFCTALIVHFTYNQNEGPPRHKYIALSSVYIFLLQETTKLWGMPSLLSGLSNKEGLSKLQSRHKLVNAAFLQQCSKSFSLYLNNSMALIHNKKQTLSFQSDCVHIIKLCQLPSL